MSTITWTGAAGDNNYNNPANWSPAQVPTAADTAVISTTVATTIGLSNAAVGALTTKSLVTLALADNTSYTIGSTKAATFNNGGTFTLNSTADNTNLIIGAPTVTLTGTGKIVLGNNNADRIYGAAAADVLSNSSNTIMGGGQLGAGQLTLVNGASGTINANANAGLVVNTGTITVTNSGLMEATGGVANYGGLVLQSTVNDGTKGRVSAAGGNVYLQSGIVGGTLSSSGAGAIIVQNGHTGTLSASTAALVSTGTVDVNDNATLVLNGSISNSGTFAVLSTGDASRIALGSNVTLSGTGSIVLNDTGHDSIIGAATTLLTNNQTIAGAGVIGNGAMGLANNATGVIDATGTKNRLVISTGTVTATNSGILEATGPAGLQINTAVNNGTTGKIEAVGSQAIVALDGGTLSGGTLITSGGGLIDVEYGNTGTLNGVTSAVNNTGNVNVNDNATLDIQGSIVNTGTIALKAQSNGTRLIVTSAVGTLSGGGTLLLGDNGNNLVYGAAGADELLNKAGTIAGSGQLGNGQMVLLNSSTGTINATGTNAQLVINTGTLASTNQGLIEATGAAGLTISHTVLNNTGTIQAIGSTVYLTATTISGGTLKSSAGGSITVAYGQGATLDGTTAITSTSNLVVADNGVLTLAGTLTNGFNLALNSQTNTTQLIIGPSGAQPGTVTLNGGGKVTLSDEANNRIVGAIAGDELLNVNNTIMGSGQLGGNQLVLVNDATINATGVKHALIIQTGGGAVTNAGLIEATGAAGLVIVNSVVTNTGTLLSKGGNVYLQGAYIAGGLLSSTGTNATTLSYGSGATIDGSASKLTNSGVIAVSDDASLTVLGTLTNTGTLSLAGDGDATRLIIGPGGSLANTVTLTGGGQVTLSDSSSNYLYASSSVDALINANNTISGAGNLGNGTLTLTNQGTINATGSSNALVISTGGGGLANSALVESTGAGGLVISNTTVTNTGTIAAAGGNVYLQNSDIVGGLLKEAAGSSAILQYGFGSTLDGSTAAVTTNAALRISDNASLTVLGSLVNTGTISLLSSGDATRLIIASPTLTLTGAGSIVLSDNASNLVYASTTGYALNNVNETISGAGALGNGSLALVNGAAGVIDATGSASLVVNTGTSTTTNSGLMESTASGGLVLQSVVSNTGTGAIAAAGGDVYLQSADIQGGTLSTSGGGAFIVGYGQPATLDGSTSAVNSTGIFDINDNASLTVLGSIVNSGTISLLSSGDATRFIVGSSTATLSGGGTILLSDASSNLLYGAATTDTLTNLDNTITGAGALGGNGQFALVNAASGVIDASDSQNALVINNGTLTNSGLIESTNTGGLVIQSTIAGGTTGILSAAGGDVYVEGGTIAGGILNTSGGGAFVVPYGNAATLDGSVNAVTSNGQININDNGSLTVLGAIVNNGSISLLSTGDNTRLILGGSTGTVTLSGAGTVSLANTSDLIYGAATADTLNNAGNTIIGYGQFGDGQMTLINTGTIEAVGGTLNVNLGSTGRNNSGGKLLAKSGTMSISNGTYTNATGAMIEAQDAGVIAFAANASLTNDVAGVLTNGLYGAVASGHGASLSITGPAVTKDAATIVLQGAASSIVFGTNTIESSLGSIAANGALQILGGRSYSSTLAITNSGALSLGGGTFSAASLTEATGSTLSGFGTLTNSITSSSSIVTAGGALDFAGAHNTLGGKISGTGTLQFDGGATTISAGTTETASSIALINGATLNTSGQTLTVLGDYTNTASGIGNAYNPFAGVTGTINGHGTQLAVVGVDGTVVNSSNGTFSISIAPGGTADFVIENTGAAGSAILRGALQTSVNGGNITSSALSGTGITAQDFGGIAAGAASGTYAIAYSSGALTNQAIHLTSDFANVPGITIDILAKA
jgi:hypothetical protein